MIQKEFADRATDILNSDKNVIGVAVAGSWLTNEIDRFSDLDLILVTEDKFQAIKTKCLITLSDLDSSYQALQANMLASQEF